MLTILRYGYKATKPRTKTINSQNLHKYRTQLRQARRKAHMGGVQYLTSIQDDFLKNHKQKMAQKHFNNQCYFRGKIARNSYILYQQLEKGKSEHRQYLNKMDKFVREQEIKKLNRDRIKKILQYENANIWLQGEDMSEKIISDRVLPEFVGSTQYYHKLHYEALAYEDLDFQLLHKLSSNQQSVQYKNQLLVPLFKQLLILMKNVKYSDLQIAENQLKLKKIQLKSKYENLPQKLQKQLEKADKLFEDKKKYLEQLQKDATKKIQNMKSKAKKLILLLKKWKQYTDVLGMTSNQVLEVIHQSTSESQISNRKKLMEKEMVKDKGKNLQEAIEEDTEDQEVSLSSFLNKNEKDQSMRADGSKSNSQQTENDELIKLLREQQSIFAEISRQSGQQSILLNSQNSPASPVPNSTKNIEQLLTLNEQLNIDEGFLKPSETTTTVQYLKEQFKDDQALKKMLDLIGQITIQYPRLFKKIWQLQKL